MSFAESAKFLIPGRAEAEVADRVGDTPGLLEMRQQVANFLTGRNLLALFAAADVTAVQILVEADIDLPVVQPVMGVAFFVGLYGAPVAHWMAGMAARDTHNQEQLAGIDHNQLAPPIQVPDTIPENWNNQ